MEQNGNQSNGQESIESILLYHTYNYYIICRSRPYRAHVMTGKRFPQGQNSHAFLSFLFPDFQVEKEQDKHKSNNNTHCLNAINIRTVSQI
jgi:hypothetical protein